MVDYNNIFTCGYVRDKHSSIQRWIERQFGDCDDLNFYRIKDEASLLVRDIQKHLVTQYPLNLAKKILMHHRFEMLAAFYLANDNFNGKYHGDNAYGHELMMIPIVPELLDGELSIKTNGKEWVRQEFGVKNCDSMVLFEIHPKMAPEAITRFVVENETTRHRQKTIEFTKNSFTYEFNGLPLHMFSYAIVCRRGDTLQTKVHFNGDVDKAEVAVGGHREEVNVGGLAFLEHREYRKKLC